MAALPAYILKGEWQDWYAVNAMSLAGHCRARGRYELALELHDIGTEWYERNVVLKREPGDTAADRKNYREVLAGYKAARPEFALLIATRPRLIESLGKHQGGVDRNALKREIGHQGATTFGTICNQLERGGWIRQQKEGKKYNLLPALSTVSSDEKFVASEIPTPAELRRKADATPPIATVHLSASTSGRKGCLTSLVAVALLLLIASRIALGFAYQSK